VRPLSAPHETPQRDLVLVGGGHAHVQVLRRLMMRPEPGVRTTVVLDRAEAVYSGMVPGFVAGDYAAHELEIDVVPLARRAGANVVLAAATCVDPRARRIDLEGRPPIRYDVASLDVGATVRGLSLPGVAEHALATRPIRNFVDRLDERVAAAGGDAVRIAVVGAGAAGVELAFTLAARVRAAGRTPQLTLLTNHRELLHPYSARVGHALRRLAEQRGIRVLLGVEVVGVEKSMVLLGGDAEPVECDLAVWATGAAPVALLAASPLPLDPSGFVKVGLTLQVDGHEELFAVGDCASIGDAPWVRKAGVYAVRAGPVLDDNLRARLRGEPLERFRPQRDFLSLIHTGDRSAFATKWGRSLRGSVLFALKDAIDRRFMNRFQVLASDGALAEGFPTPESMGMEEMECGGCAAKVGVTPLERALARLDPAPEDASVRVGLGAADDAALLELPRGDRVLATVDAFRAFCDDPWLVGRVAAVNAVSDVQAKGGRARHALAFVTVPDDGGERSAETLYQVLSGVRAALDPLGVSLVGGHSTLGPELFVGLSVTGDVRGDAGWLRLDALEPGDALVLSKPLGTGVLLAADMRGLATGRWMEAATASMLRDNAAAAEAAVSARAHACTDVSGFGLAGHLIEMLRASDVRAVLELQALPVLDGVLSLLESGVRSTYHEQNAALGDEVAELRGSADALGRELLFDPQTSGGLLIGIAPKESEALVDRLRAGGDPAAAVIGRVVEGSASPRIAFGPQ
jgi:selenide,water dikinase